MSLFDVGRLCVKIAGRDAGKTCVVVERLDNIFVVVDGSTRRKKVNVKHLEPLAEILTLKDKASHDDVREVFTKRGLVVWNTKPKTIAARPKKQKKQREKAPKAKAVKDAKKSVKVSASKDESTVETTP